MDGDIKSNKTIGEHYKSTLEAYAKGIQDAKEEVSEDKFTNCDSVTTPKSKYNGAVIPIMNSYVQKLLTDVRHFDEACKELHDFDYKRSIDISTNIQR